MPIRPYMRKMGNSKTSKRVFSAKTEHPLVSFANGNGYYSAKGFSVG